MDKSPFFGSFSSPFNSQLSSGMLLDTSTSTSVKKCRFCDFSLQGISFAAAIKHEATHVVFCPPPPPPPSSICKKPVEPEPTKKPKIVDDIEIDCTNVDEFISTDDFFRGIKGFTSVHGGASQNQNDRTKKEIFCDQDDKIAQLISDRIVTYNVHSEWKIVREFYQCLSCGTQLRQKGLTKEKLYLHSIEHRLCSKNKIKILKKPAHLPNLKSMSSRPTCKATATKSNDKKSTKRVTNGYTTEIKIENDEDFRNLEEEDARVVKRVSEYNPDLDWKEVMVKKGRCKFLECIKCGLRYKRYLKHQIFHHTHSQSGEKALFKFKCRYKNCSKEFVRLDTRNTHLLTHLTMDERPFPCNFCDFRFYRLSGLGIHVKRRHKDKTNKSSKKIALKSKIKSDQDLKTKVKVELVEKDLLESPIQNQNQKSLEKPTWANAKIKIEPGLENFQDILKSKGRRSTNNSFSDVDLDLLDVLTRIKEVNNIKCEVPDPEYCSTNISMDQDQDQDLTINTETETRVNEKTENPTFNQTQEDEMIAEMVSNYDVSSEWVKIMNNKKIECLICHSQLHRNSTSKKTLFLHSAMHKKLLLFQCRYCKCILARPHVRKVHENIFHLKVQSFHCTQCSQSFRSYSVYHRHKNNHKKKQKSILNKNRYKNKKNSITSTSTSLGSHTNKPQIKLTKNLKVNIPKLVFSKCDDNKIKILDLNGNEKTYLSTTNFNNSSSEPEPNNFDEIEQEIDENLFFELNKPIDFNIDDLDYDDDLKPDIDILEFGRNILREEEMRLFSEMEKKYDYTQDWKRVEVKGKKVFKCLTCEEIIVHKRSLLQHKLIHTGQFPFKCFYCSKRFRGHIQKVRHENIHLDPSQRMYTGNIPCSYNCGKVFESNYRREEHEYIHTGKKNRICNICKAKFGSMSTLYHHKRNVHNHQSRSKRIKSISKAKLSEISSPSDVNMST